MPPQDVMNSQPPAMQDAVGVRDAQMPINPLTNERFDPSGGLN